MFQHSTQLLILGSGPGGYTAAFAAADLGLQVTLVDENALGGVCLYEGCIPSKSLLRAAAILSQAKEAEKIGITFTHPNIDLTKLRDWKNEVIQKSASGLDYSCKQKKVNFIQGHASFLDAHKVSIKTSSGQETEIQFEKAIIATGSQPTALPHIAFSDQVLNSTTALELNDIPASLLIIGGGYISSER